MFFQCSAAYLNKFFIICLSFHLFCLELLFLIQVIPDLKKQTLKKQDFLSCHSPEHKLFHLLCHCINPFEYRIFLFLSVSAASPADQPDQDALSDIRLSPSSVVDEVIDGGVTFSRAASSFWGHRLAAVKGKQDSPPDFYSGQTPGTSLSRGSSFDASAFHQAECRYIFLLTLHARLLSVFVIS